LVVVAASTAMAAMHITTTNINKVDRDMVG
jgi:hypothetical protein